jgi:bidirectional [NiFe] hydrogenase diaphorase subunit
MAAGCMSSNSEGRQKKGLEKAVKDAGLEDQVEVRGVGCMKLCCQGPLVQVDAEGATVDQRPGQGPLYQKVTPEDAPRCRHAQGRQDQGASGDPNHPFFTEAIVHRAGQQRRSLIPNASSPTSPPTVTRRCTNVLREMTPKEVVDHGLKSGLRGRGGAGYPTGLKWGTVAKTREPAEVRHLQRGRGRPRRVHGPQRAGKRSAQRAGRHGHRGLRRGRDQGFIYVRAEYPLAISRLQTAIKQAKQHGPAGQRHFESPFNFNIDLRIGAGRVRLRRGNALMASVEGKRGTPRPRPPFPAESGLVGIAPR